MLRCSLQKLISEIFILHKVWNKSVCEKIHTHSCRTCWFHNQLGHLVMHHVQQRTLLIWSRVHWTWCKHFPIDLRWIMIVQDDFHMLSISGMGLNKRYHRSSYLLTCVYLYVYIYIHTWHSKTNKQQVRIYIYAWHCFRLIFAYSGVSHLVYIMIGSALPNLVHSQQNMCCCSLVPGAHVGAGSMVRHGAIRYRRTGIKNVSKQQLKDSIPGLFFDNWVNIYIIIYIYNYIYNYIYIYIIIYI